MANDYESFKKDELLTDPLGKYLPEAEIKKRYRDQQGSKECPNENPSQMPASGIASQFSPSPRSQPLDVRIVRIDMPFQNMVEFMVKWALASIPAALILLVIAGFAYLAVLMVLGG